MNTEATQSTNGTTLVAAPKRDLVTFTGEQLQLIKKTLVDQKDQG